MMSASLMMRVLHAQRLKDPVVQEVAVELPSDAVDEDAECQISKIAVAPLRARRKRERQRLDNFQQSSSV